MKKDYVPACLEAEHVEVQQVHVLGAVLWIQDFSATRIREKKTDPDP